MVIRLTLFYQLLLLSILIVFYIIFLRELFILSKSKFAIQRKPSFFFYIIEIVLTLFSLFKSDGLHDTVMLGWQRGCEMMAFEHFG